MKNPANFIGWKVEPITGTFSQCPGVFDVDGKLVASVVAGLSYDEAEEAARLIAAAPELLAALKGMVGKLPYGFKVFEAHQSAIKAIDRAEGRQV